MKQKNIFYGRGKYKEFVECLYKRIQGGKWFTYADVMAESKKLKSADELDCSISKNDSYGQLKKAFMDLRKIIKDKYGKGCFEEEGNNRNKRYRYVGEEKDPLREMCNAKVIGDLKQYWQFCQDSAGFFPTCWLDYFFKDSWDLLNIKTRRQNGEQVLESGQDRMLRNIELLPLLYESIVKKQVLSIDYKPYGEEMQTLQVHPHYLKEFNGRWHLFGHAEGQSREWDDFALDRIETEPRELNDVDYVPAPAGYYADFFRNIVGVSHREGSCVERIHIRARSFYIFKLTESKTIHPSQQTVVPYGKHEDGEYGEFVVEVELNNEFMGRILQMGSGLEVVSPEHIRTKFREKIEEMAKLYE